MKYLFNYLTLNRVLSSYPLACLDVDGKKMLGKQNEEVA